MKRTRNILKTMIASAAMVLPFVASAHEVYVLTPAEIARDKALPPLDLFGAAVNDKHSFIASAIVAVLVIVVVLGVSLSRKLERVLDPFLIRIKPYALHIAQITLGLSLIASAHYGSLFGPEIPLAPLFGGSLTLVTAALYISGAFLLVGAYPRLGGLIAAAIFVWATVQGEGQYMLSYFTYFGEGMIIFLFGGGYSILRHTPEFLTKRYGFFHEIEKRKNFIIRVSFGIAIMYAALYAKLFHGALALNTVMKYHLTNYFHFDPLFVVLGAFLIEMMIGVFFCIGFELRFTALFFLTFLTMSLLFFGEVVWPHIILIGSAIALLVHGYDEFTIERIWYKKGKREPVL